VSKPAYLIQGDPLFRAQKISALTDHLNQSRGPLETETVRLSETSFDAIFLKVRNKPFFAKTQLFIFLDAPELKPADLELLENYFMQPADFSVLIFEWEEAQDKYRNARAADGANQLSALIKKAGGEIEKAAGSKSAVGLFIREKLKAAGKTIDPVILQKMEREWQDFPLLLDSALNNMILAAGVSPQITLEMAEAFEDHVSKGDRFKLLEAILVRNTRESLNALARILDAGEDDPIALISFFHGQFRLYWQAQRLLQHGFSDSEVFKKLGISQGRAYFFSKQMRVFSLKQLEKALEQLFELDRAVKTGEGEPGTGMERWIVQTTEPRTLIS